MFVALNNTVYLLTFVIFIFVYFSQLSLHYLSNNISSTERDANISIDELWFTTDRLMTVWKSDFSDKMKLEF